MWVQIYEANRSVVAKPASDAIPWGTSLWIPKSKRIVPKLISKVMPVYPPLSRQANIWGDVVLDVTLKEDGSVNQMNVIEGHPMLAGAAMDAVKQWRYQPLLVTDKPVLNFVVVVSFEKGGKIR